ncbi:MAG TPA: response regulator [bacterium]|nr:response regulator [bacterium]
MQLPTHGGEPPARDAGATVLLVEDDPLLRKAAESALRRDGFRVLAAANGEEALQSVAREVPDLVLLDLVMPGIQGYDVLRALKGDPATAHVPVVILTNLGQGADVERAMQAGAAAYAIKAELALRELTGLVRKVLLTRESPRGT